MSSLINTIRELQKEVREFIDSQTKLKEFIKNQLNSELIKRDIKIKKEILRKLRRKIKS